MALVSAAEYAASEPAKKAYADAMAYQAANPQYSSYLPSAATANGANPYSNSDPYKQVATPEQNQRAQQIGMNSKYVPKVEGATFAYNPATTIGNVMKDAQGQVMGYVRNDGTYEPEGSYQPNVPMPAMTTPSQGTQQNSATTPMAYSPNGTMGNNNYQPSNTSAGATPPMDAAAIQKYAADQVAAKLAAATNSANTARTSAQADAAQSNSVLDNQLAQAIAKLQAAAQQSQAGVQTGYDRAAAITADNRVLSDSSFQRNTNPFSGATDYKAGIIGREREISDRQAQQDLASRLGAINQDALTQQGNVTQDINTQKSGVQTALNNLQNKITTDLQNLETSTGAERERLIREITADERQYALALRGEDRSDVLANATLAQQKFQQELDTFKTNYGIQKDSRDFNYQVGKDVKTDFAAEQALTYKKEQDKIANEQRAKDANWSAYMQSVGLTGNTGTGPKADWGLLGGTDGEATADAKYKYLQSEGAAINNQLSKLQLENYPQEQKLKMQQLQKQIEQIGKAPYQSATDMEMDKVKLQTAQEQLKQLTTGKTIPDDDVAKMIESSPLFQKQYDENNKLINTTVPEANKQQLAQYIASLGLPADQAKKWFIRYGLWNGDSGN